jgi:hypothetical protein
MAWRTQDRNVEATILVERLVENGDHRARGAPG